LFEFLPKKRGRPKNQALRDAILDSAKSLFFVNGVFASSMDAIAEKAGVSNRTIYSHFSSKEDLLWAVVQREGERFRLGVPSNLPANENEFWEQLSEFGRSLLRLLSDPDINALGKLLLCESQHHPKLAQQFYSWGPQQTRTSLARLLNQGIEHGWLTEGDSQSRASQLIGIWQAEWHLEQQLGLRKPLSTRQIHSYATQGVELLQCAYGKKKTAVVGAKKK
jgi:TetR/AcrR family transcriptional repressor of mexJK operon